MTYRCIRECRKAPGLSCGDRSARTRAMIVADCETQIRGPNSPRTKKVKAKKKKKATGKGTTNDMTGDVPETELDTMSVKSKNS